ncbi:MAG: hypothetical protein NTW16_17690 [Bacteroidetes bacterium]|nr:hypothetical protein [Bacteroidota bacterium]
MRPSFFKRVKRAIKLEFRRIKDEHRSTGRRHRRPSLSSRFRHWFKKLTAKGVRVERRRPAKPHLPPLTRRIKSFYRRQWDKYRVVFSSNYLIIILNSTILYLVSFFLVHFLTHLVTGITAYFCDISTTLNYTFVDFHIRYWNWTEEMVIVVFSVPAIFALIIALLTAIPFTQRLKKPRILHRLRYITKSQRRKHRQLRRKNQLDLQVQRLQKTTPPEEKRKVKKRISWSIRLFLLWTLYHSATYFFSGMLYAFLFHRRFGYVIWYAFNNYAFDLLFSAVAFLALVIIGYIFSVQFFNSGRMYLNSLNERNRMPFVVSQAIFPFIIGTIVTIAMQIPDFDLALVLLNFSLFFLLLPLPSRAAGYDTLHFDKREKVVKIYWHWLAWSVVIILSVYIALKTGIPIRLP